MTFCENISNSPTLAALERPEILHVLVEPQVGQVMVGWQVASLYKSAIRIAPTTRMKMPPKLSAPDAVPEIIYPKSVGTSIIKQRAPKPARASHKKTWLLKLVPFLIL